MTNEEKMKIVKSVRMQEFSARANELSALENKFGEAVSDIVIETRAKQVEGEWQAIAGRSPRNDIQGLIDTLWRWVEEAGFKYTIERTEKTAQMTVTYCPLVEMAKELGQEKWGYKCYCCDDYSITKGFNPKIKFSRTKTLMEGHECCNHFYSEGE